jgi:EAL domain-containing protein (putative c-di-GMP-specific phosphodiesterase class I)
VRYAPEHLECIRVLGCDNYQGFQFGKPLPVEQFVALLKNQH